MVKIFFLCSPKKRPKLKPLDYNGYRFFGPFSGYRGSFQTQGMLKRSIIDKKIWSNPGTLLNTSPLRVHHKDCKKT